MCSCRHKVCMLTYKVFMLTYKVFMSAHKVLYIDVQGVYVDAWSIMHADRCQIKYNRQSLDERRFPRSENILL